MNETRWAAVDHYLAEMFVESDPALQAALEAGRAAGLPAHDVSPNEGKLLHLLARIHGARTILEIGTLAGYSAIWMARALPPGGRLITLEANPRRAELARANINLAGLAGVIDVRAGAALETLPRLAREAREPFDLIFIDADKRNNPGYLEWALRLSRPGTLIIAHNVVRGGEVADPDSRDPDVLGARRFNELIAADPRLTAAAIQTVGEKGWDGFALILVTGN
ncbi:MAG TPA: O-methyltransferase [bacterium]|nr:O-methyltransferase [bacterium]